MTMKKIECGSVSSRHPLLTFDASQSGSARAPSLSVYSLFTFGRAEQTQRLSTFRKSLGDSVIRLGETLLAFWMTSQDLTIQSISRKACRYVARYWLVQRAPA